MNGDWLDTHSLQALILTKEDYDMRLFERDPNKPVKIAEPGSLLYYWRTKSKYLAIVCIGGIIIWGILGYFGVV